MPAPAGLSTLTGASVLTCPVNALVENDPGHQYEFIRLIDTVPGISEAEREAVTQRFYRSDKTRNTKGLGLGLSMVAAIIKLHSFRLRITAGPGCTVEIACLQAR
jgi:signal transduction histidine kinase